MSVVDDFQDRANYFEGGFQLLMSEPAWPRGSTDNSVSVHRRCNIVGDDASNPCTTAFICRFHLRRADRAAGGCHRGTTKDISCRAAHSRYTGSADAFLSEVDSRRPRAERTN